MQFLFFIDMYDIRLHCSICYQVGYHSTMEEHYSREDKKADRRNGNLCSLINDSIPFPRKCFPPFQNLLAFVKCNTFCS